MWIIMIDNYSFYNGKRYEAESHPWTIELYSNTKDEGFEQYISSSGILIKGLYVKKYLKDNAPIMYEIEYSAKYAGRYLPVDFWKEEDYELNLDAGSDFEFGKANDFERYENLFYRKFVSPEEVDELKIEEIAYYAATGKKEKVGETIIPKEHIREWLDKNYE